MRASYGALLDALRSVRWPSRRAVGPAAPGTHRSRQRGTAGEFTEYRLYRQGDDPRALDWKLLARSDRAFVRVTDDRAILPTWFVVDASASMAFPTADAIDGKWTVARALTIGMAAVAHGSGDPVGLLVASGDGARQLSARTRRGTVAVMATMLDESPCAGAAALAPLIARIPLRSRLVILSDALGDEDAQRQVAATAIAAGTRVIYVHLVAQAELDPEGTLFEARDPEVDAVRQIYRAVDRAAYQKNFSTFRAQVAERWRRIGATYAEVCTTEDLAHAVRRLIAADVGGGGA